ncbi:hypothetical protein [Leptobacterium sp. I13]|uniref:AbiU2 domain-containing protein n=1 Tax=Leptobacterium meishanense TaxID=3128904 RepID=UPI0030EE4EFA
MRKSDFNIETSQIWLLYTKSYEYYHCLVQLRDYPITENSNKHFIRFIKHSSWYILVIELCKIFEHKNDTQHYNVYRFLNLLKNNYKGLEFNDVLSKSDIDEYCESFNAENIIKIREKIKTLRNKFYAHTDRYKENFIDEIDVTLSELELLFSTLRNFIIEIRQKVLNSHSSFETDIFIDLQNILVNIHENNKKKHDNIIKKWNDEMS